MRRCVFGNTPSAYIFIGADQFTSWGVPSLTKDLQTEPKRMLCIGGVKKNAECQVLTNEWSSNTVLDKYKL